MLKQELLKEEDIFEEDFVEDDSGEVAIDEDFEIFFPEEPMVEPIMIDEGAAMVAPEMSIYPYPPPPYCDPYYEDCYGEKVPIYEYSKVDVHRIVWTSLFQAAVPALIYSELAQAAYDDWKTKNGVAPGEGDNYYTIQVSAWEKIMYYHAAVWGPMTIFGILSLSDVLNEVTALYIEHALSNF